MKMILVAIALVLISTSAFGESVSSGAEASAGAIAVSSSGPQYPLPQPIYPYLLQMIPGVIADITKEMPLYDAIKPLTIEKIVDVVTFNGSIFDRIRMEDMEKEVLNRLPGVLKKFDVKTAEFIRYKVRFKMSSRTVGSGGGGGGSVAGFGGGTNPVAYGSNASIMPGIAVNTADPQFVISFYLIAGAKVKKVGSLDEKKYMEQGWTKVEEKKPARSTVFGKEVSN